MRRVSNHGPRSERAAILRDAALRAAPQDEVRATRNIQQGVGEPGVPAWLGTRRAVVQIHPP